jgi:hypothetical protein
MAKKFTIEYGWIDTEDPNYQAVAKAQHAADQTIKHAADTKVLVTAAEASSSAAIEAASSAKAAGGSGNAQSAADSAKKAAEAALQSAKDADKAVDVANAAQARINLPGAFPTPSGPFRLADTNSDNAKRGAPFTDVNGKVVSLATGATPQNPDAAYVTSRDLLFKTHPYTPSTLLPGTLVTPARV